MSNPSRMSSLVSRQLRQRVEPHGVAEHHEIEPAAPTGTTGDRAELLANPSERLAVVVEELGHEGAGADPGGVGLGDPDDTIDVARAESCSHACAARRGVGRRDVGVRAVVEVEERRLRTFEQDVGIALQTVVQQADRVAHVGGADGHPSRRRSTPSRRRRVRCPRLRRSTRSQRWRALGSARRSVRDRRRHRRGCRRVGPCRRMPGRCP